MDHKGPECQTPEGQILCINNCGFFGNAATMNMCSKCHKELMLKQEPAKMVDRSFGSIMNVNGSNSGEEPVVSTKRTNLLAGSSSDAVSSDANVLKAREGILGAGASVEMGNEGKGSQAPETPILCTNNCGFFGSSATMNMCSKCHRESILNQGLEKLVGSSVDSIVNDSESNREKSPVISGNVDAPTAALIEPTSDVSVAKNKVGSSRCSTCRKRVGLVGFTCRCGSVYCSMHRHADMHECKFDYRASGRVSIAKANPVVKRGKLDKI